MKITLLCILLSGYSLRLDAVFIAASDLVGANANTSAPVGDQGWTFMGIYNGASSIYVGSGWFITAAHLGTGASNVNFQSTNYSINSSTWTIIQNPDLTNADIRMFQINSPELLPSQGAHIIDSALTTNADVTMIGYGRNVSSVEKSGADTKYYEGTTSQMKWGQNTISSFVNGYSLIGYKSDVFQTNIGSGQAQALDKDSGGGVFIDAGGGNYQLAGVMIAAQRFSDTGGIFANLSNPQGSNSWTRSVDLYQYRDQIVAIIPEPGTIMLSLILLSTFSLLSVSRKKKLN